MITTYLADWQIKEYAVCIDNEIHELLQAVRGHGLPVLIQTRTFIQRKWSWKDFTYINSPTYQYEVYIGEGPDVQCYNFPGEGITTSVNKDIILTWLLGVLNGIKHITKKSRIPTDVLVNLKPNK